MKLRRHGPSLYYASDKNIFDALNQHKVDTKTIVNLFERRNIVVSKDTPRSDLAAYFSRQIHDYQDHKEIAARLGIAPRRERITSIDVEGKIERSHIQGAVDQLKAELERSGEVVNVSRDGDKVSIHIDYSVVDYKVSEFAQRQNRDGTIELIKTDDGYTVRNTHNEYLDSVTDYLIGKFEAASGAELKRTSVSLFGVTSARLRSKFFHDLAFKLTDFQQVDVMAVYVYKARPESEESDDEEDDGKEDSDTHVERVHLKGQGVTRSAIFNDLLDKDDYYVTKIAWRVNQIGGGGDGYDIEAAFTNPRECTGFSYILSGVYQFENGKISSHRRQPHKHEVDHISRVIEEKAREIVLQLQEEFTSHSSGEEHE